MKWKLKKRKDLEIAPDEIFLDASNISSFDRSQFEGRLEKPLPSRTFIFISSVLAILFVVLVIRSINLQIVHGSNFAEESAHNSLEPTILFAPRGVITDVNGVILAENSQNQDGSLKRNYPMPSLGAVIGYVSYPKKDSSGVYYDTKEKGIAGIESEYDFLLAGNNGQLLTEKDALGNVHSEGTIIPPEDGETIRLSIDANLQRLLAKAIANTASSQNFIAGSGVIIDVHSGAVRAIVSYPFYDPNVMSSGGPSKSIAAYNSNIGHPFLNHAVQGAFTPGSVVKPMVASGVLTDGLITPNTVINDQGFISLPDPYHPGKEFIYKGWRALGAVDVRKAIAWSSDIFFYTVGGGFGNQKGLGIDRLDYWYQQYGFGSPTGIDLPGETGGRVPTPDWKKSVFNEPWYLGDTYFTSIGQYSMQVTPIQMARATAAIANGGKLFTPTMLADKTPSYVKISASNESLAVVREGMRQGVTNALAGAVNLPYVKVAAKTGTAQTGIRNQYDNSWIEGFFPYDNPQYAFAVVLERGPSGAGEQAVNAMREFFDYLYSENSPYIGRTLAQ